jgi:hypothetical protein
MGITTINGRVRKKEQKERKAKREKEKQGERKCDEYTEDEE